MKIVLISDTHSQHNSIPIPEADMVIHAGDFSKIGKHSEFLDFINWFAGLSHRYKVFISGNHDFICQNDPSFVKSLSSEKGVIYLDNASAIVEGLNIYGSPITPVYGNWAFTKQRGSEIRRYWENIPDNTDILITHGPPNGILDLTLNRKDHAGCEDLKEIVFKVKPKLHVFGHIHEGSGIKVIEGIKFVNASCLDIRYNFVHYPKVINL